MELWTSNILVARQVEDTDLNCIRSWMEQNTKPPWDEVRGSSPSLKAYYHPFDSLSVKDGVIYRHIEQINGREVVDQLLLPRALQEVSGFNSLWCSRSLWVI